jgi:protein-arginine kinase activator protein McsA
MMEGVPHEDAPEETSLDDLKQQLAEAIATENYELASELKKKIDGLDG